MQRSVSALEGWVIVHGDGDLHGGLDSDWWKRVKNIDELMITTMMTSNIMKVTMTIPLIMTYWRWYWIHSEENHLDTTADDVEEAKKREESKENAKKKR